MSSELVWFETRKKRFRWQWWGWKKVDPKPIPKEQAQMFYHIAAAPYIMQGVEFRVRPAKV